MKSDRRTKNELIEELEKTRKELAVIKKAADETSEIQENDKVLETQIVKRGIIELKRANEKNRLNAMHLQKLLDLHRIADNTEKSILDYMLDVCVESLQNQFAFIGTMSADEAVMTIHAWSKGAMEQCAVMEQPMHFPIVESGLWGEVIRQRRPVIVNDYDATNEYKKGYPKGHVSIERFLIIPIFSAGKIVAVAAVANKVSEYDESDVNRLTSLLHEMWNLIEHKRAEEEIKKSNEQLNMLYQHLSKIREEECAAISRNIHDEIGQALSALKMDLSWTFENIESKEKVSIRIANMIKLVTETIKTIHFISSELRPRILDDLGLTDAIEWYCDEFKKKSGIKCMIDLDMIRTQNPEKNIALFRILQESLTNIIRHSNAKNVTVKLAVSQEEIHLTVQDDGIGIQKKTLESWKSLGLIGMNERIRQFHGQLNVESEIKKGTKISATIPINS